MGADLDQSAAIIRTALKEDIGDGDVTSESIFSPEDRALGQFIARSSGVIAGLSVAAMVFHELDPSCRFTVSVKDGTRVDRDDTIASVEGPARVILSGERTALNFLQRMSGIATLTRSYVDAVDGTRAIILDTRKTAPGLRAFDKIAVRAGGGQNHRRGLFDMVLIKDNHIDTAGSITESVKRVRSGPSSQLPIEAECRTINDVSEALALRVDRIMLDNMDLETIAEAVRLTDGAVPLEVSGNVTLANVRSYAETGVDYISVGALTHSVAALDISMIIGTKQQ